MQDNYYNLLLQAASQADTRPKNTCFLPIPKGKEYEYFCISLAQGYELDWISFPYFLINEYGEPEHVDSFNKRHPNFTKDVRTASAIVSLLRAVFRSVITSHYQLSAK